MNGYAVQVGLVRVIDGDTVIVRAVGMRGVVFAYRTTLFDCPEGAPVALQWIAPGAEARVRFADYKAPELNRPGGQEAKDALANAFYRNNEDLWLFVESPADTNRNGRVDLPEVLRQLTSFERIVGRIMAGSWDGGCQEITKAVKGNSHEH